MTPAIWGYLYVGLLITVTVAVLWIGDRETRISIVTVFLLSASTLATVILSGDYWTEANPIIIAIDLAALVVFLNRAFVSRRHWPTTIASLQMVVCITHAMRLIAADIFYDVYSAAQGFWSYPQILIILLAAIFHHRHNRHREDL
ncbi:hypothetical protein [Sphingopyxis macrogoltabida]|uniref:Uncharacterized protein n=1 Tax=Sphingopyxis macrogoltabida TaxID=33050 RepID=A0AAC8Z1N3_SPHMC|nr:hypothetical protein [Sphingopyxis macrogoltabida]ALJ12530.1 hypothetical protein LH19_06595 [Sphingopyxis macrogoltabida]AMU89994.1 hypothetical protein ATM17_13200 [Sphingopyxis macrogoltabida]